MDDFKDEVGPGWHPIIKRLVDDLTKMGWDGNLLQVKEKFGTLRFYINAGNDEMWERIAQAKSESSKTCENCGQPGTLRHNDWLKTLCSDCNKITP